MGAILWAIFITIMVFGVEGAIIMWGALIVFAIIIRIIKGEEPEKKKKRRRLR